MTRPLSLSSRLIVPALLVGLCLMNSGCATIVKGTTQSVSFASNPDGATVYVAGAAVGKTPVTINLSKKSGDLLRFEKEGFKPYDTRLKKDTSLWFFGNVLIGGFFGSTTDAASGAVIEYRPNHYMVTLEPLAAGNDLESGTMLTQNQKIKDFIVTGYTGLQSDLSTGEGAYLDSLISLLEIPKKDVPTAKKQIRALSELHPTVPEFADAVSAKFARAEK